MNAESVNTVIQQIVMSRFSERKCFNGIHGQNWWHCDAGAGWQSQ